MKSSAAEPGADAAAEGRFDVREYARTARGSLRDSLELAGYAEHPLPHDTLRMLAILGALEGATMQHLRNVLVTATHKDARVTAFLVSWAFEKFWIADAATAVLDANGGGPAPFEGARRRGEAGERRGPIRRAVAAIGLGVPVVAVHMTLGLVDDGITRAAWQTLADTAGSAALRGAVREILGVKERHAAFFAQEARVRLGDERAARLTRRALVRAALPIGAIDRPAAERDFFEHTVFGGDDGRRRAAEIEAGVAALPGLGGGAFLLRRA